MRLNSRSSASLVLSLTIGVSGFGAGVFASEQQPPVQPPAVAPPPAPPSGPELQLSADEAVRLALDNNLTLRAEKLGPQIGTYGVAQARAVYNPSLTSTTLKRESTTPPDFLASGGVGTITTSDRIQTDVGLQQNVPWFGGNYSVSLDASRFATSGISSFNPQLGSTLSAQFVQPLLRDFKIDSLRQQLKVAQRNEEIAGLQLKQQLTSTESAVRSAYYDLVGALGQLDVARRSLELSRESLRQNQRRVEVGTMARIDIIEAEAEVARVEESVIIAEAQIKTAEDNLRTLILNPSQPDFWSVRLVPSEKPMLTAQAIDIDQAVKTALANRTDLAELRQRLGITEIGIEFAKNQKLPEVDLIASYDTVGVAGTVFEYEQGFPPVEIGRSQRNFAQALRDVFGNEFKTWSVQVSIRYPLGTSPAGAALAANRLQREQQLTTIQNLEIDVARQIRDAGRRVNTNLARVDATRKAREFAQTRLEAEEKRVTAGLATTFQLLQAQRDLSNAALQENRAIIDYNRALVDFRALQTAPR